MATLDTMIRVEGNNITSFIHYEKPTTTNVLVQKRSALDENSKLQILANDLRRTKQEIPKKTSTTKEEIVENKPRKMIK